MIVARCPSCKNSMKCNPNNVATASKRCVYCGKTFKLMTSKGDRIA